MIITDLPKIIIIYHVLISILPFQMSDLNQVHVSFIHDAYLEIICLSHCVYFKFYQLYHLIIVPLDLNRIYSSNPLFCAFDL